MEMMRTEIAAIIAGGDVGDARLRAALDDGMDAGVHRLPNRILGQPVDDDLHHGLDPERKLGVDRGFQRRAIGVVGRGDLALVFGADLRARAHDPARERRDDALDLADGLDRALARGEHGGMRFAEHEEIAAAHRLLGEAGGRLAQELAVHDRDAPEPPPAHHLRHLPAVAEEAQRRPELQLLLAIESGEAGRARARQHALTDPVAELALELVGVHGEEENGDAGTAVQRLVGGKRPLDAGFSPAGDHRSGEAGHGAGGDQGPFEGGRGDDDPRAHHGKGLGERLDDGNALELEMRHRGAGPLLGNSAAHH